MHSKLLSLSINGTPIPLPQDLGNINARVGNLGVNLVSDLVTLAFVLSALLCFGYVVYGGIQWVISQGDKKAVENARNTIIYAVVGLAIVFFSVVVIRIIQSFLQIPLLLGQ